MPTILMSTGALIFIIGFVLQLNKKETTLKGKAKVEEMINMALADGILTENEKSKISEASKVAGMDPITTLTRAEKLLLELAITSETQLIDYSKKAGDDFEKFVIQRFNQKYYKILSWAGDKFVEGIYDEKTTQPDIQLALKLHGKTHEFAVECKWKSYFNYEETSVCSEAQLNRYKKFSKEKDMPVFIALGIGGSAEEPKDLYIIPLNEMENESITFEELKKYWQRGKTGEFYYHAANNSLFSTK
ncbi:MAG: hypothetical protein ACJAZ3_001620 [Sphingobacteriales bacterium]|jgi:hypothetical protein